MNILLDPGHGGHQPAGKSPPFGERSDAGHHEKNLVLDLCSAVAQRSGGAVALTRSGDQNLRLGQRQALVQQSGAQTFLSIHAHAGLPPGSSRVWIHPNAGAPSLALARALERSPLRSVIRHGALAVLNPEGVGHDRAAALLELSINEPASSKPWLADQIAQLLRQTPGAQPAALRHHRGVPSRVLHEVRDAADHLRAHLARAHAAGERGSDLSRAAVAYARALFTRALKLHRAIAAKQVVRGELHDERAEQAVRDTEDAVNDHLRHIDAPESAQDSQPSVDAGLRHYLRHGGAHHVVHHVLDYAHQVLDIAANNSHLLGHDSESYGNIFGDVADVARDAVDGVSHAVKAAVGAAKDAVDAAKHLAAHILKSAGSVASSLVHMFGNIAHAGAQVLVQDAHSLIEKAIHSGAALDMLETILSNMGSAPSLKQGVLASCSALKQQITNDPQFMDSLASDVARALPELIAAA